MKLPLRSTGNTSNSTLLLWVYSVLLLLLLGAGTHGVTATNGADDTTRNCTLADSDDRRALDVLGDGTLLFRHYIDSAAQAVTVQLEYAATGGTGTSVWLGVSFTETRYMVPNIAVIGLPDTGVVQKYDLQSRSPSGVIPLNGTTSTTLTNATITSDGTTTVLTFTKPLVEDGEVAVTAGTNSSLINWAYGYSNELAGGHANRGTASVTFTECNYATTTGNNSNTTTSTTASPVMTSASAPTAAPVAATNNNNNGVVDLGNGRIQRSLALEEGAVQLVLTLDTAAGTLTVDMVHTSGTGYIAFAISKHKLMPDSLAVIAFPDDGLGQPRKWDMTTRSNAGVTLAPDSRQTLQNATYYQNDTHTGMTFTKLLTEDGEPPISVTQETFFLYAIGGSNSFGQHAVRNSFAVNVADASGSSVVEASSGASPNQNLWMTHGILMAMAWAILVPIAIATSILRALLPTVPGLWFQIHRGLNVLGVSLTVAGFAIAVHLINKEDGDSAEHFGTTHEKLGLVVFIFACGQAINGIFRPHLPHAKPDPAKEVSESEEANEEDDDAELSNNDGQQSAEKKQGDQAGKKSLARVIWEYGHRVLGTVTLVLAWYNCSTGIEAFNERFGGPDQTGILWGVVGGITGTTVILAIYQKVRKQ